MNRQQLRYLKDRISIGDLYTLQEEYQIYQQNKADKTIEYHNDPYLFQQLFTHACQKRQFEIAKWLHEIYQHQFDPVTQLAVRHTFNYCHAIMDKRKHPQFKRWLHQIVQKSRTQTAH